MPHRFACLLGNGFALQYQPLLSVGQLTADLGAKFQALGAPANALTAIPQFSSRLGASFEEMLGPIQAAGEVARELRGLVGISPSRTLRREITDTADFAERVHRVGMATVLGLIASRCTGGGSSALQPLRDFVSALTTLVAGREDDLVIATLNYDGLSHSALLDGRTAICDLALGYGAERKQVVFGSSAVGVPLRVDENFPRPRTVVLQLHGSLGWLRSPLGGVWKFELSALRAVDYWTCLEKGRTRWKPVVVLTDRKERTIERDPYRFAYDLFEHRLANSDRWLIAGYGRGDTPVNEMLRRAWRSARKSGIGPTELLVVEHSTCGLTAAEIASDIYDKTGIPTGRVAVTKTGVSGAPRSSKWATWQR